MGSRVHNAYRGQNICSLLTISIVFVTVLVSLVIRLLLLLLALLGVLALLPDGLISSPAPPLDSLAAGCRLADDAPDSSEVADKL